MAIGIVSYGIMVPSYRLRVEEVWDTWYPRKTPSFIKEVLGVREKAINRWDEDTIVMAYEAGLQALTRSGLDPSSVRALYLGSCTNPFVTKPSSTIVAELLGLPNQIYCMDCQFGTKSGTGAMQIVYALLRSQLIGHGLAIGSDSLSRHVQPNSLPEEYTAAAGAGALLMGEERCIAEIEGTTSYVSDTPDFFRLDGQRYMVRGLQEEEEFIGYDEHIAKASELFFKEHRLRPEDFSYAIFSQPSLEAMRRIARHLGFGERQLRAGLIIDKVGDAGSATPLIALAAVLDEARADERIFLASYGYGAGADIFSLLTTKAIEEAPWRDGPKTLQLLEGGKEYVDYKTFIRMERKYLQEFP